MNVVSPIRFDDHWSFSARMYRNLNSGALKQVEGIASRVVDRDVSAHRGDCVDRAVLQRAEQRERIVNAGVAVEQKPFSR